MNIVNIGLEPKEQYPEMATVKNDIKINKKEKNMRRYSMNVDVFLRIYKLACHSSVQEEEEEEKQQQQQK